MGKKTGFDKEKILEVFLGSLLKLQNVERGSIWVKQDNVYTCIEAIGDDSDKVLGLSIGNEKPSIVGWVIENGRMTISRVGEDNRHFGEAEKDVKVKSSLIVCFPLIFDTGEVYGALELIDTTNMGSDINLDKDYLGLLENIVSVGSIALGNYTAYTKQVEENKALRDIINGFQAQPPIIGQAEPIQSALAKTKVFAGSDYPVLITGESGTGKELFARELHLQSSRRDGPFLTQNCSAIPETLLESELFGYMKGAFTGADRDKKGLFEASDGGTLFLDEIGDMPYGLQSRILRVLQNGEIKPVGSTTQKSTNVRIISATNVDLTKAIQEKRFREDLFYRLNVLSLHIPPLRERREDIPLLLKQFIAVEARKLNIRQKRLSPAALDYIVRYPWKGNIRELENAVRNVMVTAARDTVEMEDLPPWLIQEPAAKKDPLAHDREWNIDTPVPSEISKLPHDGFSGHTFKSLEKAYILFLLEKNRWNITRAAAEAALNRSTFDSRMKRLGIRKDAAQSWNARKDHEP
jgi:transcriptional regulator with GAF, ATPase, and Fis domain